MDREECITKEKTDLLFSLKQIDKKVYACKSCDKLVEKFPNSPTVFLGKDNDIVLVGEAPANNGWRKSHQLWKDVNGKILPSGMVLQKLFDIINRDIFETTFLESVKCYPKERKYLKICSKNCKDIMLEQLKILNPKLIITLGESPTRNLLDFKFNKFADVVGNIYEVNGYKILPIYHPSPISPKSYAGNVQIFEKIKDDEIVFDDKNIEDLPNDSIKIPSSEEERKLINEVNELFENWKDRYEDNQIIYSHYSIKLCFKCRIMSIIML